MRWRLHRDRDRAAAALERAELDAREAQARQAAAHSNWPAVRAASAELAAARHSNHFAEMLAAAFRGHQ
jgi:hypothetical protein